MSGMGTWVIAASMSDVFAAIAPVAAHHNIDGTDILAEKLKSMPVLAVHSSHDQTCTLRSQETLWDKLKDYGNEQLNIFCVPNIDHCSVLQKAYCDNVFLFEWLLRHSRKP